MLVTIELTPELEQYIQGEIHAGRFASTREAVEAGIARLMLDPVDELDESDIRRLRTSIQQMKRGEVIESAELHARLRAKQTQN
jgi:Arc/MetJ-type ribon-helix-helix transcriptional regulator